MDVHPGNCRMIYGYAVDLDDMKDADEKISLYKEVIRIFPTSGRAYNNLGSITIDWNMHSFVLSFVNPYVLLLGAVYANNGRSVLVLIPK